MVTVALIVFGIVRPAESGAQAEIRQFDVTVAVDQDVVRFDIAMNETHFVYTLHGTHQLGYVKSINTFFCLIKFVSIFN